MTTELWMVAGAILAVLGVAGTVALIVLHRDDRELVSFVLAVSAFLVGATGGLMLLYAHGERDADAFRTGNPMPPICDSGTPSAFPGEACWTGSTPTSHQSMPEVQG